MDRRSFLGLFGAAVGGVLLEQAIPFNRVWSFPTNIVIPDTSLSVVWYDKRSLDVLKSQFAFWSKDRELPVLRVKHRKDDIVLSVFK